MPSGSSACTATSRASGPQRATPSGMPTRPLDGCSATSQPGPTAHCSRSSRSRCFCSPAAGWCSTSATYPRRGERPTRGWPAAPSRSDARRRGSGLSPPSSARSRRLRASRRRARRRRGRWSSVPCRRRPSRRRLAATAVIADRHVATATATATAIARGDGRPRGRVDRSPPRGKHPRQHTNRRAAGRAGARPAGTAPGYLTTMTGRSVRSAEIPTRATGRWRGSVLATARC